MRLPIEREEKLRIDAYAVNHLPIVTAFASKLGLVELINHLIPCEMEVEPGVIFLGMILDTLSGRSPLYLLENLFDQQDTGLLLGKELPPGYFADHNVARVMDRAYDIGSTRIYSEIARRALKLYNVSTRHVSFDTTSVSVYGEYNSAADLKITNGYSKDHRPDLKQFLVSMLCVDRNIPIFGKAEDGNASDKKLNHTILSSISKHMHHHGIEPGAFIYIADSAMVTEENLVALGADTLFITRLPANYKECGRVIKATCDAEQWTDLGVLAITKPTRNRPATQYKAHESEVVPYRALVVHSSAHDKRRRKRIERELATERKELQGRLKAVTGMEYFCRADACKAAEDFDKLRSKYYRIESGIKEVPKYYRGRPKAGVPRIREMRFCITADLAENQEAIEQMREEAGCFVLLSNVPDKDENAYDADALLRAYIDQHGIEQNFGFLKDPAIANAIFLKKSERIEILGLVLLMSLLIWRLIEHSMREYVRENEKELPGWQKSQTKRPTTYMMTTKFKGIIVIKIEKRRKLSKPLNDEQKEYLAAMGIRENIFTDP